jgi:circadian clock protein KaiB
MTHCQSQEGTRDVWNLSLFVAGREHPKSVAAYANLKRICEEHLPGAYQLQVIDITKSPEMAVREEVLAIPTLVRRSPPPKRRIIGDLSDTDRVLISLGLQTPGSELPF